MLAATSGAVPLVLSVPTPGRWLVAAAQQAQREGRMPGPPDAAQAETAAIYSADFLRTFAGTGVDGLLLDEGRVPAGELIHPEAYRPVLNVAGSLRVAGAHPDRCRRGLAAREHRGVAVWLGSTRGPQRAIRSLGHRGRARTSGMALTRRPRPSSCSPPSRPRPSPKPS